MLEQDIFKAIEEEIPICGEYFQEIISDIQIKRIDFENSIFKECKFENCDFSNSSFSNIEMIKCNLKIVNLFPLIGNPAL